MLQVSAPAYDSPATRVRWRVLAAIVLAGFTSYVLRYNVSVAGPAMMTDLGIGERELGLMASAMSIGYAVFQIPGGWMTDRFGPRRMLAGLLILWTLLTLVTSVAPDGVGGGVALTVGFLVVVRFLVGATHAPIFPLVGGTVERWFPAGRWALPNGLSSTGLTLGSAASAPLMVWLVAEFGWRWAFALLTPLALLTLAVCWRIVRDRPELHPAVNRAEGELINTNRPVHDETAAEEGGRPVWLRLLGNRSLLLLAVAYASMNYVFYLFFYWVYIYLVNERGFDAGEAGYVVSLQWVFAALGALVGGAVCDWACRRYGMRLGCAGPAIGGVVLSGLLFAIGTQSDSIGLVVGTLALSFFFNQMTEGAFWAAAISIGGRRAGTACGIMNTGGNLTGVIVGLLVPFTIGLYGWEAAMLTGTAFAFLSATLWLFVRADRTVAT